MELDHELKLDFNDVLIAPRLSRICSRNDVNLSRDFEFLHSPEKFTAVPIIASNMDATGTIKMAKALEGVGAIGCLSKFIDTETIIDFFGEQSSQRSFLSIGITDADFDHLQAIKQRVQISRISIEVANGYMLTLSGFVGRVRQAFPDAIILAGSVCTPNGVISLIKSGADIVRVGIGSGSVCITRRVTGVGYPQLSAVIECAQAAHEYGGLICSDGGCTVPGDIGKAFCAGADFVMLGGMLAGHDESAGRLTYRGFGRKRIPHSKEFYGMASDAAQDKHYDGRPAYGAAEGKKVRVPYRGPVAKTIQEIFGGLRSMMTYIDAANVASIPEKARLVRVNNQLNTIFGAS